MAPQLYKDRNTRPLSIGRAKLDATDVKRNFIAGMDNPTGIAIG